MFTDNFNSFLVAVVIIMSFSIFCHYVQSPRWPILSFILLVMAFIWFFAPVTNVGAQETPPDQLVFDNTSKITVTREYYDQIQWVRVTWEWSPIDHPAPVSLSLYLQSKNGPTTFLSTSIKGTMMLPEGGVSDAYYPEPGNYVFLRDGLGRVYAQAIIPPRLRLPLQPYELFIPMSAVAQ